MKKINRVGFTLVELSIVLVIIGLIIGSILFGSDLIRTARIRSTIAQFETYNTAVKTFQLKYNNLPGDMLGSEAANLGFYYVTSSYAGYYGYGDGNGVIHCGSGATNTVWARTQFLGEPFMFWRHLSDAMLIDGNYGKGLNISAESNAVSAGGVNAYFPASKIAASTIEVNSPGDGKNYYVLSNVVNITGVGAHGTSNNPITALDAYQMDSKMDDGIPATGNVFAIDGSGDLSQYATWMTVSAVSNCVSSGAYATNPGITPSCSLRIKF